MRTRRAIAKMVCCETCTFLMTELHVNYLVSQTLPIQDTFWISHRPSNRISSGLLQSQGVTHSNTAVLWPSKLNIVQCCKSLNPLRGCRIDELVITILQRSQMVPETTYTLPLSNIVLSVKVKWTPSGNGWCLGDEAVVPRPLR
jgi:hypothetical protein